MLDSVSRFTTRVENYAKYRPTYPPGLIELLKAECGLTAESVIADVGSGTGILSELLLQNGNKVFGVEPNNAMRMVAESLLTAYPQFFSVEGAAESTTLPSRSVNAVTAGQAFHWFDTARARAEFARILKPPGWVVLVWNERRLDSSPFLLDYEQLMMSYGTDYQRVRYENINSEIPSFFAPQLFKLESFDNSQEFDFEGLQGRVFSSSYTPEPGDPSFNPMMEQLRKIYETHQKNGHVAFEYDTKVYYGHIGII